MRISALRLSRFWPVAAAVGCPLAILAAAAGAAAAQPLTDSEKEAFLRNARIVSRKIIPVGITASERATLTDGRLTHDAHLQTIDKHHRKLRTGKRTYVNLRDSYQFNIAAYRLDRLLGLNMVPVSVERSVGGDRAAVTWWVDDVLMMASDRRSRGVEPPDPERWNDQIDQARAFNQLIYNSDPNLGNFLITTDWRLWMVDFTRSFRTYRRLQEPESIQQIDRRFYRGLRGLDSATLGSAMKGYLRRPEVHALIARRDELLQLIETRIAAHGEARTICDLPGH